MKKYFIISYYFVLFNFFVPVIRTGAEEPNFAADRIIVKFNEATDPEISRNSRQIILFNLPEIDELNIRYGCVDAKRLLQGRKNPRLSKTFLLKFRGSLDIPALVREYYETGSFQ
jgi:hypothetical protein